MCSVQFSCSVMFDSLQPHGLQHTRPPCTTPTPRVYSNSCPLCRWCHPTISSSVVPFSSHLQAFPASGSFPMSQLFTSGGQSIGVSASASVLPINTQDWSPLGWDWLDLLTVQGTFKSFLHHSSKASIKMCYVCSFSFYSFSFYLVKIKFPQSGMNRSSGYHWMSFDNWIHLWIFCPVVKQSIFITTGSLLTSFLLSFLPQRKPLLWFLLASTSLSYPAAAAAAKSLQSCPTLCNPMNRNTPGLPVHHQLPESTQTHVHCVSDAIQLSHPMSSPSPPVPSQHQGLFQWVRSSYQVVRVLKFLLHISPSNKHPGLISFRMGLVGSPCRPRDSQESPPTPEFKSINSSVLSFLHSPTLTSIHDHWKNHSLD